MADQVSIVVKMQEDITSKLRTIADSSQGCSKEFEDFQRRAVELGQKFTGLNTRYQDFIEQSSLAKAGAAALKKEMSDMQRAARQSGEGLDKVEFAKLAARYQALTSDVRGYSTAIKDTEKDMRSLADEIRKMDYGEWLKNAEQAKLEAEKMKTEENAGGSDSGSEGGGASPVSDSDGLGISIGTSKIVQELGGSLSEAAGIMLTSAIGPQAGGFVESALSGIASGLEAGQFLGEAGSLLGFEGLSGMAGAASMGLVGLLAGVISGGAKLFEDYDNSFKDYYGGLYDSASSQTAERISSGSGLAAGRETTKLSFTTLLGGEDHADVFLEDVLETANTTPFLYDDLVGISKTMLSFNTAVDDIIPTLTKVGDAGAALGLSTGDIGTVATYLGRMQSSDKASLEYLNPLNERGFSVFQWLADDLGVSIADIYSKISKNELSGNYVSDVILTQFEKLYGGMMEVQSKSTEGLDSTLEGLKENINASGGESYNALRNESKEADISAYSGALGDKLAELSSIAGQVQAYGENLAEQFQREALNAVLLGDLNKETTIFSPKDAEKLEGLAAQFSEAEEAYRNGSLEAGDKMVRLQEEAESLATAAYESSEWAQAQVNAQIDEIAAIRGLTAGLEANTNALRLNNEKSRGFLAAIGTMGERQRRIDSLPLEDYSLGAAANSSGKTAGVPRRSGGADNAVMQKINSLPLYAYGLDYVPYDEYPALLHQGERVLTAAEARELDRGVLPGAYALGGDKGLDDWTAGRFAFGLRSVPFDDFPALLHQGERVLPASGSQSAGSPKIDIHIGELIVRQESDIDEIAETLARKIQMAMLRGGG